MARKVKDKPAGPRSAGAEHKVLGSRIRAARMTAGVSQDELGKALGISFQQVQKYEKGVNRVELMRLIAIAKFLNVPLTEFTGSITVTPSPRKQAFDTTLATREGAQVIEAMSRMNEAQRQFIVEIARKLPEVSA